MSVRFCGRSFLDSVSAAQIRRPPGAGGGAWGFEARTPSHRFLKKPLSLSGALGDFS